MGQSVMGAALFGAGVVLLWLVRPRNNFSYLRSDGAASATALLITCLLAFGFGLVLVPLIAP